MEMVIRENKLRVARARASMTPVQIPSSQPRPFHTNPRRLVISAIGKCRTSNVMTPIKIHSLSFNDGIILSQDNTLLIVVSSRHSTTR